MQPIKNTAEQNNCQVYILQSSKISGFLISIFSLKVRAHTFFLVSLFLPSFSPTAYFIEMLLYLLILFATLFYLLHGLMNNGIKKLGINVSNSYFLHFTFPH